MQFISTITDNLPVNYSVKLAVHYHGELQVVRGLLFITNANMLMGGGGNLHPRRPPREYLFEYTS